MTTSQPISPHQRPSLSSEIRLNRFLPSKHLELLSEDLSQAIEEGKPGWGVAGIVQEVTIIPIAAATMTTNVAQPKYLSKGVLTCLPITLVSLVKRMTSKIRGGASKPLITADQNSIFTALKPA